MTKETPAAAESRGFGMQRSQGLDGAANWSSAGLNLSILCQCSCTGAAGETRVVPADMCDFSPGDVLSEHMSEFSTVPQAGGLPASAPPPSRPPGERGIITYCAEIDMPLVGPALREGEVWHLLTDASRNFERVTLAIHENGFAIKPADAGRPTTLIAWSPFSLVQACRLHSVEADAALPWLRLFKVSVYHHGCTHFFASRGAGADAERARWVADIARTLRTLTQSLFPPFSLCMSPVIGAEWTSTRLVAGYMLLCNNQDVSLVYCELHAHKNYVAAFVAYKDDYCDARIMHISIAVHTCVSERVGVDCSCFSIDGHHFSTRTSMEKTLWLRAISNVKVKLRHRAENPTDTELANYRAAIFESSKNLPHPSESCARCALLPQRATRRGRPVPIVDAEQSPGRNPAEDLGNDQAGGLHTVPSTDVGPPVSGNDERQTEQHTPRVPAVASDDIVDAEDACNVVALGPAKTAQPEVLGVAGEPCPNSASTSCGPNGDLASTPPQLPLAVDKADGLAGQAEPPSDVEQDLSGDSFHDTSAEPVELPMSSLAAGTSQLDPSRRDATILVRI